MRDEDASKTQLVLAVNDFKEVLAMNKLFLFDTG